MYVCISTHIHIHMHTHWTLGVSKNLTLDNDEKIHYKADTYAFSLFLSLTFTLSSLFIIVFRHDYHRVSVVFLRRFSSSSCNSGRKRRPSDSYDEEDPIMDDCSAAMVLMSLSCSPKSPLFYDKGEKREYQQQQLVKDWLSFDIFFHPMLGTLAIALHALAMR